MFALGIRYLNGWAMASHHADRDRPEWPPHPDRIFMALAAAHFETDGNEAERRALQWLEALPAPKLAVGDATRRTIVTSYVPVNDTEIARGRKDSPQALAKRLERAEKVSTLNAARDAGLALLPEHRSRQARNFPVALPTCARNGVTEETPMPHVYLIWDVDVPQEHRQVLADLCAKVTSVGHSASFVQMWVEPSPPPPTHVPREGVAAAYQLRIPTAGRLEQLEARYVMGLRPSSSLSRGYVRATVESSQEKPWRSCFDEHLLIFRRVDGPRLGVESTLVLTKALRETVMSKCGIQPPPEWVSGHAADGSPSQLAHLAFMPLPHVGHEHADGRLLGVAVAIPRNVPADEQRHCLGKVLFHNGQPRELTIRMGRAGVWTIVLDEGDDVRKALSPQTWAPMQGTTRWATVTPIVFDRHPKKPGDAETTIANACRRIDLPEPVDITLCQVSPFIGVPHARRYPLLQRKTGGNLNHTHAILTFDRPVVGPVLLGAGRFRGYGMCRPLWKGGGA